MKNLIKKIILESLKQYLKEDAFLEGIWYHGSKKNWDGEPHLTVGEFDNVGGFFLSKNINFAKGYGNIIKAYNVEPNADIFDVENKNHILRYAEQVKKEIETPRKLDYYPMPKHLTAQDYAILLDNVNFKGIDHIEYFIKKAYPEIKTDVFNTVMDDGGIKYQNIQYLIRNKRLFKDYHSIEKNDSTLRNAGFDGAYVFESGDKNIQLYKTNVITNVGKVNTKTLNERIEGNKVICDNCNWQWNLKDGGKDPYVCHKCGHDNNPNILNERCWKGYTQKGMKTMFGKQYPNCVKITKEELQDYKGSHTAPSKDYGASMDRLNDIYPDDIYSSKALQYYGEGYPYDRIALAIMQGAKDKPNKLIKIYRAVPDFNYEINKEIKELLKINQYYDKFNFLPTNSRIVNNLKDKYPIDKYSFDKQTQLILQDIFNQVNELKNKIKNNKIGINSGDWVTTTLDYAKSHGQSNLNNKYKVVSKVVPARTLYTNADSIHEWGYNP